MILFRRLLGPCLAALLIPFSVARAQEHLPRIGYAYPAGGRQGTTFQVTLGGQYLNDISRIHFSGAAVEASVIKDIKPMTEPEANAMRERLTNLERQKGQKDAATLREMAEIRRKFSRYLGAQFRRQAQPAISETVVLQVKLAANAEPGVREMRVETPRGFSNPLRFHVGRLPEFREGEPDLVTEPLPSWDSLRYPATVTTDVTLPAVANGQIVPRDPDVIRWNDRFTPGDADRWRFSARKGQQVVIVARARELIPYLADAVPGWFQATLTLYDAHGKELAFVDDDRFHPDPVLSFKVPEDGQYVVEIKDAISRGRPDFVYRIAVGELPFITSIFPLGCRAGTQTTFELKGWNLPQDKVTMDARDKPPGVYPLSVQKGETESNRVPYAVDTLPECLEQEPNDSPQTAQAVTLPVIVNGRIDRPGDWDVFRVQGRAGQEIIAEVCARRLDSPLDSVLELTDAAGKPLALSDDHEDATDALSTHNADSLIHFTLPADGEYYLRLGDVQRHGGAEYSYRLRVSAPRHDFELRVVPSCIHAVAWRLTPITVVALRKDGFSGEIALGLKGSPEGIGLDGAKIPAGQDRVRVTLGIAQMLSLEPMSLCLEGRATVDGKEVVREAIGADEMTQAFFYKHVVPARGLTLVPGDQSALRDLLAKARAEGKRAEIPQWSRRVQKPIEIVSEQPLKVPAGGTAELRIRVPEWWMKGEAEFELSDSPEGIAVGKVARTDKALTIVLKGDAEKTKPGLKGNLIVNAFRRETITEKDGKKREIRPFMGPLPAIPFEIVKPK